MNRAATLSPPILAKAPWALAVAVVVAAALFWHTPGRVPPTTAKTVNVATYGGAAVPLAARGPISAALGLRDPAYRVRGLAATNPGQHLRIRFAQQGVTVSAGHAHLGLRLLGFGRGHDWRATAPSPPRASGNRVSYAHAGISEWYANGPLGLEQGFDVRSRPRGGGDPLQIAVGLMGDLHARLADGGLLLAGAGQALRYTGLIVTDARGRSVPARLSVHHGRATITVADERASYPLRVDPFVRIGQLVSGGIGPFDATAQFGTALAASASGNTVVVGSPNEYGYPAGSGVFVFTPGSQGGWSNPSLKAELSNSGGFEGDDFGASVGISEDGSTIVVGAPAYDPPTSPGSAYVYVEPSGGWQDSSTPTATLLGSTVANGDEFGNSVAISGDTVIVGAPQHNPGSSAAQGLGYVFVKPASGWGSGTQPQAQVARLEASDGAADDQLGCSVAITGGTVVAGACGYGSSSTTKGAAYVFTQPGGGWSGLTHETAKLTASDGAVHDQLGAAVAIAGDTIVAGAPGRDSETGAVYVFQRSGSAWASETQTAELNPASPVVGDQYGSSVAISSSAGTILAGGPGYNSASRLGDAYVFARGAAGWSGAVQTGQLAAADSSESAFGFAGAIAGDVMIVGAPDADFGFGVAYVFAPRPTITITAPAAATYTQGESVKASYSCTAPAGETTTSCAGPIANGAAINTSTLGNHGFTVATTDSGGASVAQTVEYKVVLPPPPVISKAKLSQTKFAVSSKSTAVSARSKKSKKPPKGTTVEFTLSEQSSVTLTITGTTAGKRSGKTCKPSSAKHIAKSKRCKASAGGTITRHSEPAAADKIPFTGRIGSHPLPAGSYTLTIGATNTNGAGAKPVKLKFTILS